MTKWKSKTIENSGPRRAHTRCHVASHLSLTHDRVRSASRSSIQIQHPHKSDSRHVTSSMSHASARRLSVSHTALRTAHPAHHSSARARAHTKDITTRHATLYHKRSSRTHASARSGTHRHTRRRAGTDIIGRDGPAGRANAISRRDAPTAPCILSRVVSPSASRPRPHLPGAACVVTFALISATLTRRLTHLLAHHHSPQRRHSLLPPPPQDTPGAREAPFAHPSAGRPPS
jgi:hypothetical protein